MTNFRPYQRSSASPETAEQNERDFAWLRRTPTAAPTPTAQVDPPVKPTPTKRAPRPQPHAEPSGSPATPRTAYPAPVAADALWLDQQAAYWQAQGAICLWQQNAAGTCIGFDAQAAGRGIVARVTLVER